LLRPGTPFIRRLTSSVLRLHLACVADWLQPTSSEDDEGTERIEWIPTDPPATVAKILHEIQDYPAVRPVRGITESPVLRPDHTVITQPGYDPATGLIYLPSCIYPAIPERPTQEECREAQKRLWTHAFCDFPYVGMGEREPSESLDSRYAQACACPDA